jgi:hypothetical protein
VKRPLFVVLIFVTVVGRAHAQFVEDFDAPELRVDQSGMEGWSFFSGDGQAKIELRHTGSGHASVLVDATRDRRNIWWALIKRRVSDVLDLERLGRPGWELRVEVQRRRMSEVGDAHPVRLPVRDCSIRSFRSDGAR